MTNDSLSSLLFRVQGNIFSLEDAVKSLLPNYFKKIYSQIDSETKPEAEQTTADEGIQDSSTQAEAKAKLMFVRVQGIEPKLEIPFSWVANNLMNPDYFLHLCVCIKLSQ